MHPKTPKWLQDILNACDLILRACADETLESFAESDVLTAAVERKFEIIGEALNRISKVDPETGEQIPQCRAIIGFRNVLIHGYDEIDRARVWQIVREDVPPLRDVVRDLLAQAGPPPG